MKSVIALSALAGALAGPINLAAQLAPRELRDKQSYITIHESCNVTQRRMLEKAFNETWEVAEFAQQYTLHNGPDDEVFKLYFGEEKENYAKVLGVWESLLYSDKSGVVFRCDNIDGNCGQAGWRGHWRGNNATSETVICDASYTDRRPVSQLCMMGYQLAGSLAPSTFWPIDLIHRMFHVPQLTNDAVHHYIPEGSKLPAIFTLAETNATWSPFDSDTLQFYAAHVYINEVVKAGDSCLGDIEGVRQQAHAGHSHGASSSAVASAPAASSTAAAVSSTAAPTSATSAAAAPASSVVQDCHTHADGSTHCGSH